MRRRGGNLFRQASPHNLKLTVADGGSLAAVAFLHRQHNLVQAETLGPDDVLVTTSAVIDGLLHRHPRGGATGSKDWL